MNQIRGKCVICASLFTSDDVAALRCGHTFHFPCIREWVMRSKSCPICRVTTAESHIVKHLYFDSTDDPDASQLNASQLEIPSAVQVESLSMALEQERNNHPQAAEEVTRLKSLVDKLEAQLAAAEKSCGRKMELLQNFHRDHMKMWDYRIKLEEDLEKTQNRLRACESQLDEARKAEQKLKDELKVERKSVSKLKKEEHDLKNKVVILQKELRDVRGAANIDSSPLNPKPRSLALDQRPSSPIPENIRDRLRSRCGLKSNRPTGLGAVQDAGAKALTSPENRNDSTDVISKKPGLKRRLNQNDLNNQRPSLFSKKKSP